MVSTLELRELRDIGLCFKKCVAECEDSAAVISLDRTAKYDACNASAVKYLEELVETVLVGIFWRKTG